MYYITREYTYNILRVVYFTHRKVYDEKTQNLLYWCVAYLPSEASIIEH
jgi:hypothetical protein